MRHNIFNNLQSVIHIPRNKRRKWTRNTAGKVHKTTAASRWADKQFCRIFKCIHRYELRYKEVNDGYGSDYKYSAALQIREKYEYIFTSKCAETRNRENSFYTQITLLSICLSKYESVFVYMEELLWGEQVNINLYSWMMIRW